METSNQPVPPPRGFDPFAYDPEADFAPRKTGSGAALLRCADFGPL
jgi:hypothetical protein